MRYRTFGRSGLPVSEIGHGTWAMGTMWGPRDDASALEALSFGFERGINFIDTAWVYGNGHSERLIAKALKESGEKAFIATKCPPKNRAWPAKPGVPAQEVFPADYLIEMTETSLKNLETDCVDLQQLHVWDDAWLEQGDWQEAVAKLKAQGKIRFFGVSLNDHQPDSGLRLVESGLVDSVQVIYNLFDQTPRERLLPLCREKQVGVIVRVPLDEGGLSGTLTPETRFGKGDWRVHYFKGDRLKETCERAKGFSFLVRPPIQSIAQAALKFCLSDPAVSTVIPGMRSVKHVEANTEVSDLEGFSEEELKKAYAMAWPRNYYPSY
ncbi:MAG: aldo/keto reductase [Deltaproteobacteria bacterium]|nr:aldo/keto reductase [Deltaproteobacteria bacterium]